MSQMTFIGPAGAVSEVIEKHIDGAPHFFARTLHWTWDGLNGSIRLTAIATGPLRYGAFPSEDAARCAAEGAL